MQRTQRTGWRKHLYVSGRRVVLVRLLVLSVAVRILQIVKNRFGGDKVEDERLELRFNKDTFCHQMFDKSRNGLLKQSED